MVNYFRKGPISRAILIAMLLVSLLPIVLISALIIDQSGDALTRQMEQNLSNLVSAKAAELNLQLEEVVHTTSIAAAHGKDALLTPVDPVMVDAEIGRYQPDDRNILGLDVYYNANDGASLYGDNLSNVYWDNNTPLSPLAATQIVQTSQLDQVFSSIKAVSADTQWIYLTTAEGMMRLYPWASNDHYPQGWRPHEIIFYTVANEANNPTLEPQWTPPYVDFAGAGWMVTLSIPIVDDANDEFVGVMSHDITINTLKELVSDIEVLDGSGFGFLIDADGKVISHPDFQDDDANEGAQVDLSLLDLGSAEYQSLIKDMTSGASGLGYFNNDDGDANLLVYAPIPAIGWSLGIEIPQTQVVAPATRTAWRAVAISVGLATLAIALALVLQRSLKNPVEQLLQGVHQLSEDGYAENLTVDSFSELSALAAAFNDMASKVRAREQRLKARVRQLSIQIDRRQHEESVQTLVETDYFKYLESNAVILRQKIKKVER